MDKAKLLAQTKKSNLEYDDIMEQLKHRIGMQANIASQTQGILIVPQGAPVEILKSKSPMPNSSVPSLKSLMRGKFQQAQPNQNGSLNPSKIQDQGINFRGIQSKHLSSIREGKIVANLEKESFKKESRPVSTDINEGKQGSSQRLKKFVFHQSKLQKLTADQRAYPEALNIGQIVTRATADENQHPIGITTNSRIVSKSNRYLNTGLSTGDSKYSKFKKIGNFKLDSQVSRKETTLKPNSNRNRDFDNLETKPGPIKTRIPGFSGASSKNQSILYILEKIKNRQSQAPQALAALNTQLKTNIPQMPIQNFLPEEELIAEEEEFEEEAEIISTIRKPLTTSTDFEEIIASKLVKNQRVQDFILESQTETDVVPLLNFDQKQTPKTHQIKNSIRLPNPSMSEALAQFKSEPFEGYDQEAIDQLIELEDSYRSDPYYLENDRGLEIRWDMRAMLVDWMIEVAHDYHLKISTLQIAVNFLDRYSEVTGCKLKRNIYQLVGLTCLILATKMEEVFIPKLGDFGYTTSNTFTVTQIMNMELEISQVGIMPDFLTVKALKYKLNPPTAFLWASWYAIQWDVYLESRLQEDSLHLLLEKSAETQVYFKKGNPTCSYKRYRELMQLLDITLLDVQTLQYKPRLIVASLMYIILGKGFRQFELPQIVETFPTSSLYLLDENFAYNDFFAQFLVYHFGINLEDLLPTIQYTSTYFAVTFSYESPKLYEDEATGVKYIGHFEDFMTFEVHNPNGLSFVLQNRPRTLL